MAHAPTSGLPTPDFRVLFESAPGLYLVLTPDLGIVAVSEAYLRATMTKREEILGRGLFDVFPDNPDDPTADGVGNLSASLDRVIRNKAADAMAVQKYDIRRPESEGGGFEQRYWSPVNVPVLGADGEIAFIIHRVEDVTEFVLLKQQRIEESKVTEELRTRAAGMEAEIYLRAKELQEANQQLRAANDELAHKEKALMQLSKRLSEDIAQRTHAEEEMQRLHAFLDSIIENIPNMIFVKDAQELRFVRFNRAGEELLGYSRADLLGKNDFDFFPKNQAESFAANDRQVLEHGQPLDIAEEPVQTKTREMRILHTKKVPIHDRNGVPKYLLGISEDITERKRSEEQIAALNEHLRQRSEELEAANRELEAFSYSVSHDLRAPLRHIAGFADLLQRKAAAGLDQTSRRHLDTISASAMHMGQLIDDLLMFSRMDRIEMKNTRIQLDGLVGAVIREHEGETKGRMIEWAIRPLPEVQADPAMLRLALGNLISNALKYTRTQEKARIEIGTEPSDGGMVLYIRDNGVGFDMQYRDKLFGVFQRLHRADEFEGTGIGLANVRRIIHRHGGRTWAEGAVGRGATFYFSLPEKEEAA